MAEKDAHGSLIECDTGSMCVLCHSRSGFLYRVLFRIFAIMKKILQNPVVAAVLAIIAIGSALLDYYLPAMGDDLAFWHFLGLEDYTAPDRRTISFILAHIFGCNGRLFDYMGPVVINLLPRAMAAALMGGMAALFFFSIWWAVDVPQRRHTAFSVVLLTSVLAIMPWWDGMFLRVCQFNYLWGTAFCILFIAIFFAKPSGRDSRAALWGVALLGVFAGAAHEQTGVAMSATFICWALAGRRYRTLTLRRKVMLAALFAGTFLTVAAPAIWHRAAQDSVHQPIVPLLVTTLPLYLILMSVTAVCMCTRRSRAFIIGLASTSWSIYVSAGFIAGIIAVLSGIPGRTGMFTEACAAVALARMCMDVRCHIGKIPAALITIVCIALITAHFTVSVRYQSRMYGEAEAVKREYIASSDGIVFYDFTSRCDVPLLTLNRVKGVADADDLWLLQVMRDAYKPGGNIPVVLPESMAGFASHLTDSVSDGRNTVYTSRPDNVVITQDGLPLQYYPGPAPRFVTQTTLADGRDVWIATPRVRDPGDYELPVISIK